MEDDYGMIDGIINNGAKEPTDVYKRQGQTLSVSAAIVKEGKSSPPQHFTEDTLLSAMETAGKENMPEEAERKGLGTPDVYKRQVSAHAERRNSDSHLH